MSAVTTKTCNPTRSVRLSFASWLSRLRATKGYEATAGVLGASWFLVLALVAVAKVIGPAHGVSIAHFNLAAWSAVISGICLFLFYLILSWLILHRPLPTARSKGALPSLTAFAGTYLPWTMGLFAPDRISARQDIASAALLLIGIVSMIVVISHLGRCFSIVPQARSLVRSGPYRLVRHPLYLIEQIAQLGLLVQFYSFRTLIMFLAQGALQVRRIYYEEDLLGRTFPDYEKYARSTSRLIPYIW